jgi:hypothetical protein
MRASHTVFSSTVRPYPTLHDLTRFLLIPSRRACQCMRGCFWRLASVYRIGPLRGRWRGKNSYDRMSVGCSGFDWA